tara:strand:+ start:282 stop:815 length:534 start_codon:yes stop_codon:yes gene_type:complete
MSVLNVLDTQTVSGSGTAYITVKSGVVRVLATSASSIQVDAGPAITLAAGVPELISVGKPKSATIEAATDANPTVLTITGGAGQRHNFAAQDYISTSNGGDTAFVAAFVSAAGSGKLVASITDSTITTDIDASGASADYALATAKVEAGTRPVVQRAVKLTAGSADVIVEQVQVVGG